MENNELAALQSRVAVLENERAHINTKLDDMSTKLDQLLTLKSKGVGAVWLVGLIFSSGIIAWIAALIKGH